MTEVINLYSRMTDAAERGDVKSVKELGEDEVELGRRLFKLINSVDPGEFGFSMSREEFLDLFEQKQEDVYGG